jgi:hypothetical protein
MAHKWNYSRQEKPMDATHETREYIRKAEEWFGDTPGEQSAQVIATLALVSAALAQAEQLKRIADVLEKVSGRNHIRIAR